MTTTTYSQSPLPELPQKAGIHQLGPERGFCEYGSTGPAKEGVLLLLLREFDRWPQGYYIFNSEGHGAFRTTRRHGMKMDSTVVLVKDLSARLDSSRLPKVGTLGKILAIQKKTNNRLVKWRGRAWPICVHPNEIKEA